MHKSKHKIRSTQVDSFAHLNHATYLEIFEWSRWDWAAAAGLDIETMAPERRVAPAVLHIDLSFHKEVRVHEEVTVLTWFGELEKIKGVVIQQMRKSDGQLAAHLNLSFAMFNLDTRRLVSMLPEMVTAYHADQNTREEMAKIGKRSYPSEN